MGSDPKEARMPPDSPTASRKPRSFVIDWIAVAIVLATVLVGYGLANPREVALPFAIESTTAQAPRAGD